MADNRFGVTDDGSAQASQDTQAFQNSQTQQGDGQQDPVIARLQRLEERNAQLEKQVQSRDDKLFARLAKTMKEDEAAIRRVAELEGADEKTTAQKIRAARERVLLNQPLTETEPIAASADPMQFDPQPIRQGQDLRAAYVASVQAWLAGLNVQERELGANGILDYLDPSKQAELTERVGDVLKERKARARQMAQQAEREDFAGQVRDELAASGGLGASGGMQGTGAPSNQQQAIRAIQQEKQKYLGSGNGHAWLSRKRELLTQYGLPLNTQI